MTTARTVMTIPVTDIAIDAQPSLLAPAWSDPAVQLATAEHTQTTHHDAVQCFTSSKELMFLPWSDCYSGAATVGVVGVRTPPKRWGCLTP